METGSSIEPFKGIQEPVKWMKVGEGEWKAWLVVNEQRLAITIHHPDPGKRDKVLEVLQGKNSPLRKQTFEGGPKEIGVNKHFWEKETKVIVEKYNGGKKLPLAKIKEHEILKELIKKNIPQATKLPLSRPIQAKDLARLEKQGQRFTSLRDVTEQLYRQQGKREKEVKPESSLPPSAKPIIPARPPVRRGEGKFYGARTGQKPPSKQTPGIVSKPDLPKRQSGVKKDELKRPLLQIREETPPSQERSPAQIEGNGGKIKVSPDSQQTVSAVGKQPETGREALLGQIRKGKGLHHVDKSEEAKKKEQVTRRESSVNEALRKGVLGRRSDIIGEDEEDDANEDVQTDWE